LPAGRAFARREIPVTAGIISSRRNPAVRELRAALRPPGRRSGICAIEGPRLLAAAVAAGLRFDVLVVTPEAAADPHTAGVRAAARARAVRELIVTPDVYAALTQVEAPQGLLATAGRPAPASIGSAAAAEALAVVLDGIQDPGNVGTIIRTAVACRATLAIACGVAADPFGAKALRASAGAAFHLPVAFVSTADEAEQSLRAAGVRIVVADAHAGAPAVSAAWTRPVALVLGGEAAGPSAVWRSGGALAVRVPVLGPVESLNVAAAGAVLLYQAAGVLVPPPAASAGR
jgi:TrmH family RNA methyltransferase